MSTFRVITSPDTGDSFVRAIAASPTGTPLAAHPARVLKDCRTGKPVLSGHMRGRQEIPTGRPGTVGEIVSDRSLPLPFH